VVAETAFLLYVFVVGRRGAHAGETADLDESLRGDYVPVSG
jgi:hypothetical protein